MSNFTLLFLVASSALNNSLNTVHIDTPAQADNISLKIDNILHNVNDKLFTSLKVEFDTQGSKKNNLLQKMHNNFKSIAVNNFNAKREIENASKPDIDKEIVNPLFNLTEVIDDIFEKKYYTINNKSRKIKVKGKNVTKFSNYYPLSEDNVSPNIFQTFIQRFLDKIDGLISSTTIKPFIENLKNITFKASLPIRESNELQLWVSNSSEHDVYSRRIFRGKKAKVKKYPFVVSIHMNDDFICAGSIISKEFIITAAACMQLSFPNLKFKPDIITVRVGSDEVDNNGEQIPIVDVYFHPKYDTTYFNNNLALVRLQKVLSFKKKNKKVRRIDFDRIEGKLPESGGLVMLGWGDKDSYSRYNGPISFARLEIYGLEACKEIYSENYVNDNNFCAGYVSMGSGACNRDVGGPGIIGSKLMGVISFGPPTCGTPDAPTVFTKLGFYSAWIESILQTELPRFTTREIPTTTTKRSVARQQHNILPITMTTEHPLKVIPKEMTILKKLFQDLLNSGNITIDDLLDPDDARAEIIKEGMKLKLMPRTDRPREGLNKFGFWSLEAKDESSSGGKTSINSNEGHDNTNTLSPTVNTKLYTTVISHNLGRITDAVTYSIDSNYNSKTNENTASSESNDDKTSDNVSKDKDSISFDTSSAVFKSHNTPFDNNVKKKKEKGNKKPKTHKHKNRKSMRRARRLQDQIDINNEPYTVNYDERDYMRLAELTKRKLNDFNFEELNVAAEMTKLQQYH